MKLQFVLFDLGGIVMLRIVRCLLAFFFLANATACACSKLWHGSQPLDTPVVVRNEGEEPVCGVYIWRPEDKGGTGMPATSPEINNLLKPGTYILHEKHDKALQPGQEVVFPFKVPAGERFTVVARNCLDKVIYERFDVCLGSASPIVLEAPHDG